MRSLHLFMLAAVLLAVTSAMIIDCGYGQWEHYAALVTAVAALASYPLLRRAL